jgi:hypothetical protein
MSIERQISPAAVTILTGNDYVRHDVDAERVAEFVELYREIAGETTATTLPLIEVVEDVAAGELVLASGRHRLEALRQLTDELNITAVPMTVHTPPEGSTAVQYAHELAIESDARSAKPLTRTEKRRAIAWLIERYPAAGNPEIARRAGTSERMVKDRRAALDDNKDTRAGSGRSDGGAEETGLPVELHAWCWNEDGQLEDLEAAGGALAEQVCEYASRNGHGEATIANIAQMLRACVVELSGAGE